MKDSFIKELVNFGLSEKEAKVYVALLELEIGTAFEVAKHASLNRSSTYVVLEGLKKKGFVGVSEDNTVRKYIAASPDILLQSAKTESHRHAGIVEGIESIIPELKALYKDTKKKPIIKVFEGKNGLINVFEGPLNSVEKIVRIIASPPRILKLIPGNKIANFLWESKKRKIEVLGIHPMSTSVSKFIELMPFAKPSDMPNFINKKDFNASADLAIYDNNISFISDVNGGFGIVIENKEVAEVMKNLFDLAYEATKNKK